MRQSRSFHLSLRVPDLAAAKSFYGDLLGCEIEPQDGTWFNANFFGHQLTLHESEDCRPGALDHFGVNLDQPEWLELRDKLRARKVQFRLAPLVQSDRGKFVILDPAGLNLEFKYRK